MIVPYQLTFKESIGVYTFNSADDSEYFCTFKYITPLFSPLLGVYDLQLFEFDFFVDRSKVDTSKKHLEDERISVTISTLLRDFFNTENRILVYLCDASDNMQRGRSILFCRWYKKYLSDISIRIPLEVDIVDPDGNVQIVYGCTIVKSGFEHMDVLKEEFLNKAKDLIREKNGMY